MRLIKIGHDTGNDIVLPSDKVSRIHAEITILDNGDILLEDKGSRNGTYVMNNRIAPGQPVKIMRGDAVRFADTELPWNAIPMPEDTSAYKSIYAVGSHFNNDIQLSGGKVSRYHATIKQSRKDNKFYITDHSKNGTTVNGRKIPANTPVRIDKNSQVMCADVPLDLSRLPWPKNIWKTVLAVAASVAVLVGVVFAVLGHKPSPKTLTDAEIYEKYHSAMVMLRGIYHYEIDMGDLDPRDFGLPKKFIFYGGDFIDLSSLDQKQIIDLIGKEGSHAATGFFVSPDGKVITNLHVTRPWLFEDLQTLEKEVKRNVVRQLGNLENYFNISTGLMADVPDIKVKGVLDYIALIPDGENFDPDNIIKCKEIKAGDDTNIDLAMIQTVSKRLPTADCTYIDMSTDFNDSPEALGVGTHIVTIGYPLTDNEAVQHDKETKGIHAISQGGSITQPATEYSFGHNACTSGGASGSPIFNEYGQLIGVHNAGIKRDAQGLNFGIINTHIKDLIEGQVETKKQ